MKAEKRFTRGDRARHCGHCGTVILVYDWDRLESSPGFENKWNGQHPIIWRDDKYGTLVHMFSLPDLEFVGRT